MMHMNELFWHILQIPQTICLKAATH